MRRLLIRYHKMLLLGMTLVPVVGYGALSALTLSQPNPETDEVMSAETAADDGFQRWEVVVDDYRSQNGGNSDPGQNSKKPSGKSAADDPNEATASGQDLKSSAAEAAARPQPTKAGDHTIVIAPKKSAPYTVKFQRPRATTPKDQPKAANP